MAINIKIGVDFYPKMLYTTGYRIGENSMTNSLKQLRLWLHSVEVRVLPSDARFAVSSDGRIFKVDEDDPYEVIQFLGLGDYAFVNIEGLKWRRVSYLVMEAFGKWPRPKGLDCHHIDANKLNNSPENLKWVRRPENVNEGFRLRRNRRLTREEAAFAKGLLTLPGISCKEVAELLHCGRWAPSVETIRSIREGTTRDYDDVEPEF